MHDEFYSLKEKLKNFKEFIWFWGTSTKLGDLLYCGVSLWITLNLKLAPVPYATPKWLIKTKIYQMYELCHATP